MKLAIDNNHYMIRLVQEEVWKDKNKEIQSWKEKLSKAIDYIITDKNDEGTRQKAFFLTDTDFYKGHIKKLDNYHLSI